MSLVQLDKVEYYGFCWVFRWLTVRAFLKVSSLAATILLLALEMQLFTLRFEVSADCFFLKWFLNLNCRIHSFHILCMFT